MTVLFRWIFLSSLTRVVAITLAIVAIFMIAETFDKARFIGERMTFGLLMEYLLLKVPYMISEFMPVVMLIASAIYMTEISHHHELVAIRAAGIKTKIIIYPLIAAGAVMGLFTFSIGEWVEPITNERLAYIQRVHIERKAPLKEGSQWFREGNMLIKTTPLTKDYSSIVVLKTDDEGKWTERIEGDKAYYESGAWYIQPAVMSKLDEEKGFKAIRLDSFVVPSMLGPETTVELNPRDMSVLELYQFEKTLSKAGLESSSYVFQLHKKIAAPLACIIMVLISYSLCGNMGSRISASSKGLLFAIIFGLSFYVFNSTVVILANGSQLPAVYAAWLPEILFAGFAGYLFLAKEGH